jgi:hypothetical protein
MNGSRKKLKLNGKMSEKLRRMMNGKEKVKEMRNTSILSFHGKLNRKGNGRENGKLSRK